MQSRREPKRKPVKADWLHAGLLRFAEGGLRNLQVEGIAEDLGVTKGSYYYYFKSREDFFEQMLEYSLQVTTRSFIDNASTAGAPLDQLRHLTTSVLRERRGKDLDFFLRDFARRNRQAARHVLTIDAQRLAYIKSLLIGCGLSHIQASTKAEIFYNHYLGWYIRNKDRRLTRSELLHQLHLMSEITGLQLAES